MTGYARIFCWIVFLLAAGYCLRTLVFGSYEHFGGPFRYLTHWALFMLFFAASRMTALVEGRSARRWDGFICATAVINAMVVFMYWRLFLEDPNLVSTDGELGPLYLELYLHALGPLLQWIDAVFVHRSFRKLGAPLIWLFGVIAAYVLWAELALQPLNDTPMGSVTSGLPYPFLNDLELAGRSVFYGSNFAISIVLLVGFVGLARMIRRLTRGQEAP